MLFCNSLTFISFEKLKQLYDEKVLKILFI